VKNILVVAKSNLLKNNIDNILTGQQYGITAFVDSGKEAISLTKKQEPDLIIIDTDLQDELSSLEIAEKIVGDDFQTPIIFLTDKSGVELAKKKKLIPVSTFLTKPFTEYELKTNIEISYNKFNLFYKVEKADEEQRVLLNNIQDQVWFLKNPKTYSFANKAHADFFGLNREEMKDKGFSEVLLPEAASKLIESNQKVFSQKEKNEVEKQIKNAAGEMRLLDIKQIPKINESGEVEYVVCSAEDITEQRKMGKALLEREERFLSVVATLPDILVLFNKEGEYLNIWTGHEENLLAPRNELIGSTFAEYMAPDVTEKMRYHLKTTLKYNELQVFEYKADVMSGERYFEARMTAISQDKAVVVVRDITDRKKTEEKLEVQKAYFKQLFENSPDAIVIVDSEGYIININDSFEELFEYGEEEARGNQLDNLIVGNEEREQALDYMEKVVEDNLVQAETTRVNKSGKPIDVSLLAYPIKLNNDRLGIYAIYRDISARKQLQNNLRRSKNKIEKLHEIAVKMETCENEEKIYQLTVDAAENILNFDVCLIDIVEDNMFKLKARSSGLKKGGVKTISPVDRGIAGKVYKAGESHLTRNVTKEKEAEPVDDAYRSALTVPIDKFGIFQVISNKVDDFDETDLELTELLISHTSAALKRIKAEKKIKYLGFHDSLTDLYNRSYFEQEMERLDTARNLPFSIIIGDVNNLKKMNDNYGHNLGDEILVNGGVTRSQQWLQIMADVFGKRIVVYENYEASALGAAFMGTVACDIFDSYEEIDPQYKVKTVKEPNEEAHDKYKEIYNLHQEAYEQNKALSEKVLEI
jgi:PAS domain S-box-containing protein